MGILFGKKDTKYDIYFYDISYIIDYDKYLINLREYLPESHIDMYNLEILKDYCTQNDKLIGLVIINIYINDKKKEIYINIIIIFIYL